MQKKVQWFVYGNICVMFLCLCNVFVFPIFLSFFLHVSTSTSVCVCVFLLMSPVALSVCSLYKFAEPSVPNIEVLVCVCLCVCVHACVCVFVCLFVKGDEYRGYNLDECSNPIQAPAMWFVTHMDAHTKHTQHWPFDSPATQPYATHGPGICWNTNTQ